MESKLHQNAVLTGCIDSYCLICESLLRVEDIFNHIDKPLHKKNLDAAPYVKTYKDECIRKVKKGYYCEFCNILFATAIKVNLHVAEASHIQNKGALIVKRFGNSVIAVNDICINEKAWNGLVEDICALCNLEFSSDENIHKADKNHVLNLIQKRVKIVEEKAVYRTVDNESFQCLTCNMICALNTMEAHFAEDNHKKIFQKCREGQSEPRTIVQQNDEKSLRKLDHVQQVIKNGKPTDTPKKIPKQSTLAKHNIQQTERKSDKNNNNTKTNKNEPKHESKTNVNMAIKMEEATEHAIKSNFDQTHTGTDKNQRTREGEAENFKLNMLEVPKDFNQINATCNPTESPKETSSRIDINDQAEFAKEHRLKYNKGDSNAYCRLCNVQLPAPLTSMKEHVNGKNHKNKVKVNKIDITKKTAFAKNRTIPMNEFIRDLYLTHDRVYDRYVVILNNNMCLTMNSYYLITHNMYRPRCHACEVKITSGTVDYLDCATHDIVMGNTPVVLNLDGEFVREVLPGLFHCGFCDLIVGIWETVSVHLESEEHVTNKVFAGRRLWEHLPKVL